MRKRITAAKVALGILFLLFFLALLAACGYYYFKPMNWVKIDNKANILLTDVQITVGLDVLEIEAFWPDYSYEYAFHSPGEGIIMFEANTKAGRVKCEVGYISYQMKTKTLIEILDNKNIVAYFGYQNLDKGSRSLCDFEFSQK